MSHDSTDRRRLPDYQPMLLMLGFFASGIWLDRFVDCWPVVYPLAGLLALIGWALCFRRPRLAVWRGSFLLGIAVLCAGAGWHHVRWNWVPQNEISQWVGKESVPACVELRITSEPCWIAANDSDAVLNAMPVHDRTRFKAKVLRVRDGSHWQAASGETELIVHARTERFLVGESVRVFGKLVPISGPTNPGQFDFRDYYRARSQFVSVHAMSSDSISVIESTHPWSPWKVLAALRSRLNEAIWECVAPERAGLASAVLLGNRSQLTQDRRAKFLMTGTVHLLAISGLHVGILAGVLFFLYRIGLMQRRTFLISTILFVFFYAWLVEFRAPVTRASILIILLCVGRLRGRGGFSLNWLAFAGLIILLVNPADLFQVGPQLSFLAVATIKFGQDWIFWPPPSDPLKHLIAYTRPLHVRTIYWLGRKIRTAVLVSGLIWLVAMPLVAYRFHLFAPVALVVNPLLLFPIALALYGGLGVLVFGPFSSLLGSWFGQVCDANLGLIERTIGVAQQVPGSHVWTTGPTSGAVAAFYLGVLVLAGFPKTRVSAGAFVTFVLGWIALGWFASNGIVEYRRMSSERDLLCTFVDVGHGTSVLIELPDGRNLLYDAGSLGASSYAAQNIAAVLWSKQIEHLDAIVLSHADVDHFNAVPELCERFSVGIVYMTPQMLADQSSAVQLLQQWLNESSIRMEPLSAGDQLRVSGAKVEALMPPALGTGDTDNSNSVVMLIEYRSRRILLTGDLEGNGLRILLSQPSLDVDVLLAPHHGSPNSEPEAMKAWCNPEIVVISGSGKRIASGAASAYECFGIKLLRTDAAGAVAIRVGRGSQTHLLN